MKKLFILALVLAAIPLNAQDFFNKKHNFNIAAEFSAYEYQEPGSHSISHTGILSGIWAEYMFKGKVASAGEAAPFTYFLAAEGSFLGGKVDYDGWLYDSGANAYVKYKVYDIDDYIAELRFKAGAVARAGAKWEIQPYAGVAARYIEDAMQARSPYGYNRTDLYLYIPLGAKAKVFLPRSWALTFGGELDWFILGKQRSRMSDVDPGYNNLTFDQSSGYGVRLSARADKAYKRIGIFFEPFFRYWNIKESDPELLTLYGSPEGLYVEPDNNTTEWGLRAGVFF